ncbi:MAG: hypothetical protein V1817_00345, partial [Candidatus Micrarchaeota archaeon]
MARTQVPKSGLKANFAANRVSTAHKIALEVVKQFPSHTVMSPVYAYGLSGPIGLTVIRETAKYGGFEIHGPSGHVATVDATGGLLRLLRIGKQPAIHVLKGHEPLGKALAKAFKEHAGFRISPKVWCFDELLTVKEYFDADAYKIRQMNDEAKKLR